MTTEQELAAENAVLRKALESARVVERRADGSPRSWPGGKSWAESHDAPIDAALASDEACPTCGGDGTILEQVPAKSNTATAETEYLPKNVPWVVPCPRCKGTGRAPSLGALVWAVVEAARVALQHPDHLESQRLLDRALDALRRRGLFR
jgi:hypothetical protein